MILAPAAWHVHQNVRLYVRLQQCFCTFCNSAFALLFCTVLLHFCTFAAVLLHFCNVLLRSRGAIMFLTPIHFGAICKNTYNLTTRPRQNGLERRNLRFYAHRCASAKMFHFSFTVITCFSHIFFFFLFPFFPFPPFLFFLFFLFLPPQPYQECNV